MGIDSTSSPAREDDRLATASGDDSDKRAERAVRTQAGTNDIRSQPRAETLTREQYADARRADGPPISRDDSPEHRDAPEGEGRGQPERRAGNAADHDRAEPRDRETYAADIRADHSAGEHQEPADLRTGASPESSSASGDRRADQASDDRATTWRQADEPTTLTAVETPAREQYADSVRSGDPPISAGIRQERGEEDSQPDPRFSVVEAERTLGDTTPTGIGLKPTGEQLLQMEGDKPSRSPLDRFVAKAVEDADDVSDGMGHIGEAIKADLQSGPGPSGNPRSYHAITSAVQDHPPPPGPGVSDVVGSITITGVAAVAAVRYVLSELRKDREP
jgi:hypothetical protein